MPQHSSKARLGNCAGDLAGPVSFHCGSCAARWSWTTYVTTYVRPAGEGPPSGDPHGSKTRNSHDALIGPSAMNGPQTTIEASGLRPTAWWRNGPTPSS